MRRGGVTRQGSGRAHLSSGGASQLECLGFLDARDERSTGEHGHIMVEEPVKIFRVVRGDFEHGLARHVGQREQDASSNGFQMLPSLCARRYGRRGAERKASRPGEPDPLPLDHLASQPRSRGNHHSKETVCGQRCVTRYMPTHALTLIWACRKGSTLAICHTCPR